MKGKALLCTPCTDRIPKRTRPRWRCMCTGRGEGLRCIMDVQQGNSCGNCFFDEGGSFHCDCNCVNCGDPSSESERSNSSERYMDNWERDIFGSSGGRERNPPTDPQIRQRGHDTNAAQILQLHTSPTEERNRQGYAERNRAADQSVQQRTCSCVSQCMRPAEVIEHSNGWYRWFCTDCTQFDCECNCDRCPRADDYDHEADDGAEHTNTTDEQIT